jgi:methionyl-tRNA formyltransferase
MTVIESARVVFAGTPEFAVPSLTALAAAGASVDLVLTQPDRPAGRGRVLTAPPVKQAAAKLGLSIRQPERLGGPAELKALGPRPDLLVAVAYGLILPEWLLDWPRIAPINVHASLLPRWRGAAPIQHAILAGDAESGVSIMRMTRGLDRGPVYAARSTPIGARETASALGDRLSRLGAELLVTVVPEILAGRLTALPQDEAAACYAGKIEKRQAPLHWTASAIELERQVRAFSDWPVASATLGDGRRLRVWEAEALALESARAPGSVVAATGRGIDVATGDGVLRLTKIQPPGGRIMSAAAYLAAHSLAGSVFVA